jgi:hypothetical protein
MTGSSSACCADAVTVSWLTPRPEQCADLSPIDEEYRPLAIVIGLQDDDVDVPTCLDTDTAGVDLQCARITRTELPSWLAKLRSEQRPTNVAAAVARGFCSVVVAKSVRSVFCLLRESFAGVQMLAFECGVSTSQHKGNLAGRFLGVAERDAAAFGTATLATLLLAALLAPDSLTPIDLMDLDTVTTQNAVLSVYRWHQISGSRLGHAPAGVLVVILRPRPLLADVRNVVNAFLSDASRPTELAVFTPTQPLLPSKCRSGLALLVTPARSSRSLSKSLDG